MTFYIGQKVVCIEAASGPTCTHRTREPDKGDICTVSNIYNHPEGLVLELIEFPSRACDHFLPGWLAESFRHVVERSTDISFAHEILRKASKPAKAPARSTQLVPSAI